jgi:transcription elongation GreA/GreB family factor
MDKIPMTAEGYAALEADLKHCREVERPRIIEQIAERAALTTSPKMSNTTQPPSYSPQ